MRRILFIVIALAIVLGGVAYAVYYFSVGRYIITTDNAYVEADISVIAPKVAGYVRAVPVTDNQGVAAGAPLLVIDDSDYRAAVARAAAAVTQQRQGIGTARATATAGVSAIGEAQAQLTAAQAEAVRARADVTRFATLRKQGWVSQATLDVRVADAASRDAAVAQARAGVAAARSNEVASLAGTGGAEAQLSGARATLDAARLDLANTVVRSPVAGTVGNRSVRVGQYLRTGQQAMVVVPLGAVYVVANFKETQIGDLRPGLPVTLHVDAYKNAQVAGRILSVSPAAGSRFSMLPPENATGNFTKIVQRVPVRIALSPLPAGVRLVPGMSVEASVDVRD